MADDTVMLPERDVPCPHCNGTGHVRVPSDVLTAECYFFGCWERSGHYLRCPKNPHMREHEIERRLPPSLHGGRLDGGFCPGSVPGDPYRRSCEEVEGEAKLSHVGGWTVLGWWDRTVDPRSACNSNVIVRGTHSFAAMLEVIKAQAPNLIDRRKGKPIVLVGVNLPPVVG